MRFALQQMKYANNHPEDFVSPGMAFYLGFGYFCASLLIAVGCILKMCSQSTFLDTLTSFVSFVGIALLPNFVNLALPMGNVLKAPTPNLVVKNKRRYIQR